jgi:hypothetical protein
MGNLGKRFVRDMESIYYVKKLEIRQKPISNPKSEISDWTSRAAGHLNG